jgi:NAD(P)H-nitrite reductase large subunit
MERHRRRLCGALCDQRALLGCVRGPCRQVARCRTGDVNDTSRGIFRAALILGERLDAVVFFGREGEVPPWSGLAEIWRLERLDATARRFLLAGRTASASFDASPTICACFGVKSRVIEQAIADSACFHGSDRRAAQCRHQLRIVPA